MKAILMAGGEGSRLRPLTTFRPKPLVPIGNRPIMEHVLLLLKKHNIFDIIITTHYLANEIEAYFGDGSELGIKITYCSENSPLGTAGSIKNAQPFLDPNEPFIVLSADALTTFDLTELIKFHKSNQSIGTLVLSRMSNPLEYGIVIINDQQIIQKFIEKPTWAEVISDTVNVGIYILEYRVLEWLQTGHSYDWSRDIFPMLLAKKEKLYGYVMEGYWHDIGSLEQYREANITLLNNVSMFYPTSIENSKDIWFGDKCHISKEAVIIPPVIIGKNCTVKKHARIGPYTIIGDNAFIDEGTLIEHSIIWDNSYIGKNVKISGSVIGTRVTLKRDITIYEETVIGDRCLVDTGAVIKPRVKIWGDKVIEPGATVTMSLIWGNKWHKHLFHQTGLTGLSNIEITPDFVTRIGSAFGSSLPDQAKIIINYDDTRMSRLIERAITASLLSVGCNIFEFKNTPIQVCRHFIKNNKIDAGIHICKSTNDNQSTLIEMFDENGDYISNKMQRKIENIFFREDFHRINPEEVGVVKAVYQAFKEYRNNYFEFIKPLKTVRKIKIVCDYGYDIISSFFPILLKQFQVDSISFNHFDNHNFNLNSSLETQKRILHLSQTVKESKSDFGVLFLEGAKRLLVIDNKGLVIKENTLLGVYGLLMAETHPKRMIAINHKASHQIEHFLLNQGIKVIRVNENEKNYSSLLPFFIADHIGGFIFPEIHPGEDAMIATGLLINMLQASKLTLNKIANNLPTYHIQHEKIYCTWENRGSIMRKLNEIYQHDNQVDFKEGIKIHKEDNWILIIPDPNEPLLNIYLESSSEIAVKALTQNFFQIISQIILNNSLI